MEFDMISIIIPVYNVENYLRPCVESVLNSTFRDYELILVDDGSNDSSGSLCDILAQQDERIVVIHKTNGGASSARNEGLSKAKGNYLMFVDGDDVIHPNMIEVLYDAIQQGDYDFSMVLGRPVLESEYASRLLDKDLGHNSSKKILSRDDMMKGLYGPSGKDFQYIVVWNKLYKSHLVKDLQLKITGSEDTEWMNRVCLRMNKAIMVDAEMYYWIQHHSSMTHNGITPVQIDRINSYFLCLNEIPKELNQYRAWCMEKLYKVMLHTRFNAKGSEYEMEAYKVASSAYKQTIPEYFKSPIKTRNKLALLVFYHFPFIYNSFMRKRSSKTTSNPFNPA